MGGVEACCASARNSKLIDLWIDDRRCSRVRFDMSDQVHYQEGPDSFESDSEDNMTPAEKMEVLKAATRKVSRGQERSRRRFSERRFSEGRHSGGSMRNSGTLAPRLSRDQAMKESEGDSDDGGDLKSAAM